MYKNIIWDIVGKFGTQIVSFLLSIVLTRLLTPTEYGIMGMVMVVVTFAHVFLELGFNRAIIQRPEVSQVQYSTIFYINTGMALLLALVCFASAGALSRFYGQPLIKPIFQVASLSFVINGLNLVPGAILYKKLRFKVNSIQSLASAIISGVVGVVMAYEGFGVWALLVQSLSGSFLLLVMNWLYVRWWPSLQFSIAAIKPMWAYGSRLFASGVLDTLYTRLDTFIIAKIFSPATLGYYTRAQGMDTIVRQFSANSIMGALFPYIAKHQYDRSYLKELYIRYLHIVCFVSIALSGILFLVAKHLFEVLFTARWDLAAELFQLMSIAGFAWPVSSLMCNIISGVGNSKAFLRLEVYKKLIVLPVYLFGFLLGLKGFVSCMVVMGFVGVALNGSFAGREINMKLSAQYKVVLSYFFLGVVAALLSYVAFLSLPNLGNIPAMFFLTGCFLLLYVPGAYLLKLDGVHIISMSFAKLKVVLND